MNNSKDVLAKLLSTEDVHVVRAKVPTASFDVVGRTLTLPTFVNLDENVENLMIGHEVGHALHTPAKKIMNDKAFDDKLVKNYANVIEDVRIEKLIQKQYPGLRTDFIAGYKLLADNDFFQIGDKDVNSLNLIDKINLYFKIGLKSGIKFSKEEFAIASRVDSCKNFDEVVALAKELAEYARDKKKKEEEKKAEQYQEAQNDLDDLDNEEEMEEQESDDFDDDEYEEGDAPENDDEEETVAKDEEDTKSRSGAGEHQAEETPPTFDERELESATQDALDKSMEDHAQLDNKIFRTLDVPEYPYGTDPIITYKQILDMLTKIPEGQPTDKWGDPVDANDPECVTKQSVLDRINGDDHVINDKGHYDYIYMFDRYDECRPYLGATSGAYYKEDYDNFMNNIKSDIDYMVKEFEMKKSAQRYARTETAKSGQLNANKLYNYKLSEDLFKRIQVCSDDKNHGFIMVVDWSGSMHSIMRDTIRQVIVLSTFCRKVNIPFEVLAFSNHDNSYNEKDPLTEGKKDIMRKFAEKLREENTAYMQRQEMWYYQLLTNDMNQKDFDCMCYMLHSHVWHYSRELALSGTPLSEALEVAVGYTGRFVKKHNIDKMNFITLTDGAGWSRGMQCNHEKLRNMGVETKWSVKRVDTLVDPVTKKHYKVSDKHEMGGSPYDYAYLDMIKTRYGASTIGYFLGRNTQQGIGEFARYNIKDSDRFDRDASRVLIRRNNGWASFSEGTGRDEMFFLDIKKLNPANAEISIDGQKSAAQIARQFSKGLKQNRQSKVLMSTFVERVA